MPVTPVSLGQQSETRADIQRDVNDALSVADTPLCTRNEGSQILSRSSSFCDGTRSLGMLLNSSPPAAGYCRIGRLTYNPALGGSAGPRLHVKAAR